MLITFIDQDRLLAAARSIPPGQLTPDERDRNKAGHILVFSHADGSTEDSFSASTLPAHFASVVRSHSRAVAHPIPPPLPAGARGRAGAG